jgi:molybdopterin converting factor subunit 1
MIVRVRLFARAKDLVGADTVRVQVPDGATVGELRRRLASDWPRMAELLERCAVAVNDEFADDMLTLPAQVEVAVLPPVSGGATFN